MRVLTKNKRHENQYKNSLLKPLDIFKVYDDRK